MGVPKALSDTSLTLVVIAIDLANISPTLTALAIPGFRPTEEGLHRQLRLETSSSEYRPLHLVATPPSPNRRIAVSLN
jgi:hypothetical protein